MRIRGARREDLDGIRALLAENDLPFSDVSAGLLDGFVVIEDASRALVGNVGLERFGCNALLRSLAVAPIVRKTGLGSLLLANAEDLARASRISELWLLTTTATEFFRRACYAEVDRQRAPAEIQASTQFVQLCPDSAVCMGKVLTPPGSKIL